MKYGLATTTVLVAALSTTALSADTLRLLTWGGYAPDDVIALFEAETGHTVEVTTSNNEEMIAKLRATNGGGFDLAQPSQDRITSAQEEFDIYKPIDMSKVTADLFIPSMLSATAGNTTHDGEVYGLPHVWGTSGLVVNTAMAGDVTFGHGQRLEGLRLKMRPLTPCSCLRGAFGKLAVKGFLINAGTPHVCAKNTVWHLNSCEYLPPLYMKKHA